MSRSIRSRRFRRLTAAVCAIALFTLSNTLVADQPAPHEHEATAGPTPDQALKMLMDGNARYVAGKAEHPHQSSDRRGEVAKGQKPFAVILACADSRVGPEVVYDGGLGDLFVVRVAGNIIDDAVEGSVEYAVEHLGAPLIVVMGHERCGAVKAAVDSAGSKDPAPGHLGAILNNIKPAVESEKPAPAETHLDRVIEANVRNSVRKLSENEAIAGLVKEGRVKVVGGRYDLDTGEFKLVEAK